MKGAHITLPTLQIAAAAFCIAAAQAEEADRDIDVTYCVNGAREVVNSTNCDGTKAQGNFFFARGPYAENEAVGTSLVATPSYHIDSSDVEARLAHGLDKTGLVTRSGFGKRDVAGGLFPRACNVAGSSGGKGTARVKLGG
ncbi:hypothetical protein CDD82_158 [Ophiocordyceps australis]|uniref:Uncharacterized protein n=1 Tax=Ophiocordyceps australis TaxID=1399860 RepID=A0A2C5XDZ8_9HYPO|nr:hypothetical protein CDD82_158 [Ophiocordyceps australis]